MVDRRSVGAPSAAVAGAQLAEGGDQHLQYVATRRHGDAGGLQQCPRLGLDQVELGGEVRDREHGLKVEAAFQRRAHVVHAPVARVGGGDDVEALAGEDHAVGAVQLGDRQHAFGQRRQQRVLDLQRATGDLLEPYDLALRHAREQRRRDERPRRGTFGDEQRVVPGVLDLILGGGRAAWMVRVEVPLTAAAMSSDSSDLAVPGSPTRSRPRLVARLTSARSISEGSPTNLRRIPRRSSPTMKARAAWRLSDQPGGRPPRSSSRSRASSSA